MVVLYLAGANRDPDAYDDPIGSISPVRAGPSTWPSPASTTASGLPWRDLRRPWPCSGSSSAFLGCNAPAGLRRCSGNVIRGPAELVVGPVSHRQRDAPAPDWRGATRRDLDAETWGQRLTMY
jgi:hypothetical protein